MHINEAILSLSPGSKLGNTLKKKRKIALPLKFIKKFDSDFLNLLKNTTVLGDSSKDLSTALTNDSERNTNITEGINNQGLLIINKGERLIHSELPSPTEVKNTEFKKAAKEHYRAQNTPYFGQKRIYKMN